MTRFFLRAREKELLSVLEGIEYKVIDEGNGVNNAVNG
jgi:hypothetical protein